jgi:hypothetical protein
MIPQLVDLILWTPALSFLIFCPLVCFLDWKYRDIKSHYLWIPLVLINIPTLLEGYLDGLYPSTLALISIVAVALWFTLMYCRILPGADFVWLSLISIFVVINPLTCQPFMLMFSFFLVGMTAATYWAILIDNRIRKHIWSLKIGSPLPFLIPISAAFIAAMII